MRVVRRVRAHREIFARCIMAKLSSKGKTICAIILIIAIVAGIAVYFIFFADNDYVSLEDVGDEYVLDSVEVDGSFYVNEPEPDGTLIFRNDSGDEKRSA